MSKFAATISCSAIFIFVWYLVAASTWGRARHWLIRHIISVHAGFIAIGAAAFLLVKIGTWTAWPLLVFSCYLFLLCFQKAGGYSSLKTSFEHISAHTGKSNTTRPPKSPPIQNPVGNDAWEGTFYDAEEQRSAKKTVQLQYKDGNDRTSKRIIDIRAYEPNNPSGLVIAHCRLRDATRTFRFDRMNRVVDTETGEIINDLQKQLNEEWEESPVRTQDKLLEQHREALKMMLYMAKADGTVRSSELEVIAKHCQDVTGDARVTVAMVLSMLSYVDVVSVITFTRSYNKLRRERPDEAVKVADACRAIVATQKTVHPNEQSAIDILDKPLPKAKASQ